MKIQKNIFFSVFVFVIVLAGSGIASAQDEPEMTNQQYCESQAKEAGMENANDVADYVAQCLAEVDGQNSSESKSTD